MSTSLPKLDLARSATRILIIGAGPCGIGAATRLTELGHQNWHVYDANPEVGGLAASHTDDVGFIWDFGVHVIFSHYQYYDDVIRLLGPESSERPRGCKIFLNQGKNIVNYPIQNHIHQLPDRNMECMADLLTLHVCGEHDKHITATQGDESTKYIAKLPRNFAEWGNCLLGPNLVDIFLRPYNQKIWAWSLEHMGAQWLGERVAVPDFTKVLNQMVTMTAQKPWGPNSVFKYPDFGATGAIWKSICRRLQQHRIHLKSRVTSIDPLGKVAYFDDGRQETYDCIISTVSLQRLIRQILPNRWDGIDLRDTVGKLKYSSVRVVGLGVDSREEPPHMLGWEWSYFPEKDTPFYRATAMHHCSPNVCPNPGHQYSVLMECSHSAWKPCTWTINDLIEQCIQGCLLYELITDRSKIVSVWTMEVKYGYPTPSVDRDEHLNKIQPILEKHNIWSRGRFGGWRYECSNMDHSFMQGVEAVDAILQLPTEFAPEPTYKNTDYVNSRHSPVPFHPWPVSVESHARHQDDLKQ